MQNIARKTRRDESPRSAAPASGRRRKRIDQAPSGHRVTVPPSTMPSVAASSTRSEQGRTFGDEWLAIVSDINAIVDRVKAETLRCGDKRGDALAEVLLLAAVGLRSIAVPRARDLRIECETDESKAGAIAAVTMRVEFLPCELPESRGVSRPATPATSLDAERVALETPRRGDADENDPSDATLGDLLVSHLGVELAPRGREYETVLGGAVEVALTDLEALGTILRNSEDPDPTLLIRVVHGARRRLRFAHEIARRFRLKAAAEDRAARGAA